MKTLLFLSMLLCIHIELPFAQISIPINEQTIAATLSSPQVSPHGGNVAKRQRGATLTPEHPNTLTHKHPDTLPSKIVLHTSIDTYYHHQTQLQLLEFQESKKGEWLKYLPNLGMTYTIDGKPRPRISISSSILYQAKKNKQLRAAKRQSIIAENLLEAEKTKAKLDEVLLEYQLLKKELTAQSELHEVDHSIFRIKEAEYERLECSPSEYLKAKRTYLLQQRALHDKEGQLATLKLEILQLAHWPTSDLNLQLAFQK